MTPNWFLNLSAPILNIPVSQFFFSVLIGKAWGDCLRGQRDIASAHPRALGRMLSWGGRAAGSSPHLTVCLLANLILEVSVHFAHMCASPTQRSFES